MGMDAFLVIDMQNGCFATPRLDRVGVAARIDGFAKRCRKIGTPVIFVRHDGTKENYLFPGTSDFEFIDEIGQSCGDRYVTKTANDAFYRTDLDGTLKSLGVTRLFVAGLATEFCLNATIHGALTRDYEIVVLADAHTTANRPPLGAAEIITFHNWLWAELTPTGGSIRVLPTNEAIKLVERE